jgi:hypothetical protein
MEKINKVMSTSLLFILILILSFILKFVVDYFNSAPSLFNRPEKIWCFSSYDKNYFDYFESKEYGYSINFPEKNWHVLYDVKPENRYVFTQGPINHIKCGSYSRYEPANPASSSFSNTFYVGYRKNLINKDVTPEEFAKQSHWTANFLGKYNVHGYPALLYSAKSGGVQPYLSAEYRIFKDNDLFVVGYSMNSTDKIQEVLDKLDLLITGFRFTSSTSK